MAHIEPRPRNGCIDRELEVLALVSQGHSNQDIAKQLHIDAATVKTHSDPSVRRAGSEWPHRSCGRRRKKGILRLKG